MRQLQMCTSDMCVNPNLDDLVALPLHERAAVSNNSDTVIYAYDVTYY